MAEQDKSGKAPSLGERARYMFDKSMSAGTIALIGWLALISLVIIAAASLVLVVAGSRRRAGRSATSSRRRGKR